LALVLGACVVPVTPDGTAYAYSEPTTGTVIVTAASTTGSNDREFFYNSTVSYTDSSACELVTGTSPEQPGIAFRIGSSNNVTTGITITENIYGGAYDLFDVHLWDTSQSPAFTLVAQVAVDGVPIDPESEPLHLCASVTGSTLSFEAWVDGMTPVWQSVALPSDAPASGATGFYAGHIPPGTSSTYTDLTVDGTPNDPLVN
jgi:hypothetical protein